MESDVKYNFTPNLVANNILQKEIKTKISVPRDSVLCLGVMLFFLIYLGLKKERNQNE